MPSEFAPRVRHAIYRTFADGGIPKAETIAHQLRIKVQDVYASMHELHDAHAIVIDPGTGEPRMALPFSAVPTPHLVEGGGRSWFANCAWDAFGIPLLVGVDAVISTSCPDCDGRIVYRVENRGLADAYGVVHFAVPAARWWEDITFTWETIRFFRSEEHVQLWSARHEIPIGEIMPASNLWVLAGSWFEGRLSPDWKPRSLAASQQLLSDAGFAGPFWALPG